VRVWRIARRAFQALDGEGARLYGGRWNSEGVPVVYASGTIALAALEYLVHVDPDDVPDDLVVMEIDVPDDAGMERVELAALPEGWNRVEDLAVCVGFGDLWAATGTSLVLSVPSSLVSREANFLLNPLHPDAARIQVVAGDPFVFDPRLL